MTGSVPCCPFGMPVARRAMIVGSQAGSSAGVATFWPPFRPRGRACLMETAPPPAFATLLRRYRQAAGLSQEELAERAGLSARTVGDLERGGSHAPRKDTVELLARALALGVPERAALAEAARRLDAAPAPRPTPAGTSSPPLIGRRRELASLEHHLRGQGPSVLLLAGQPGIGKTCLLQAALPR